MKFKMTKKYRYWWPVVVRIPDADNAGKIVEQKLKVLFEPNSRDEAMAATEAYNNLTSARERAEHEHAQLIGVVKDWEDVEDSETKSAMPFSTEAFAQALQHSWFRTGVYNAYADSLDGTEARLGN